MGTPRTGKPRRPKSDHPIQQQRLAVAAQTAASQAEKILDATIGADRLLSGGRKTALALLAGMTDPTASDVLIVIDVAANIDAGTRLARLGSKAPLKAIDANVAMRRSLLRDLGLRSRDRNPTAVAFVPPATTETTAQAADNDIDWAAVAAREVPGGNR
jgi:hypothetical protein